VVFSQQRAAIPNPRFWYGRRQHSRLCRVLYWPTYFFGLSVDRQVRWPKSRSTVRQLAMSSDADIRLVGELKKRRAEVFEMLKLLPDDHRFGLVIAQIDEEISRLEKDGQ